LYGAPERPAKVQDKLRFAARAGETIVLKISPMRPSDAVPTFAEAQKQLPTQLQ
jgi:hypothetical protein